MNAVEIERLTFSWQDGREVLRDLDFSVERDEKVGLIGANGVGKTTLFLLLAGIVKPSGGEVRVLGERPGSAELRGKVGFVFQSTDEQLFCSTVGEDVAFGPANLGLSREAVEERVREALGLVGLSGWEERVPHHLSGGEKRKVALASVLSMHPELLLLDEPTSDLGSRSRRDFRDVLRSLPGTKIISSHDFEFLLDLCDRIAVLGGGKIRLSGSPAEIFRREKELERWGVVVPAGLRALLRES